jgi:hypothetical protein
MPRGVPGSGKVAGKNAYYKLSKEARKKLGPPTPATFAKLVKAQAAARKAKKMKTQKAGVKKAA